MDEVFTAQDVIWAVPCAGQCSLMGGVSYMCPPPRAYTAVSDPNPVFPRVVDAHNVS